MAKLVVSILGVLMFAVSARPAAALLALGEIGVLASNAATDVSSGLAPVPVDEDPSVATDGAGNFVAVWASGDDNLGDPAGAQGIAFSRSSDGGRTWSNAALIASPPIAARGVATALAYASNGTWMAAWMSPSSAQVSRSTDDGATWSAPIDVDGSSLQTGGALSIAGDASGTWVLLWRHSQLMGFSEQLYYSRTTDDGLNWSPAASFPDNTIASEGGFYIGEIATDGSGTWVAAWISSDYGLESTRSIDGGATWSFPESVQVSDLRLSDKFGLATNSEGDWLISWTAEGDRVLASLSTDDGQSWGAAQLVAGISSTAFDAVRYDSSVSFLDGAWQIHWGEALGEPAYGIGQEGDLVGARSFDGVGWTDSSALNVNAGKDNSQTPFEVNWDGDGVLASGADGSSVLVYLSTNTLGGTLGSDEDVFFARSDKLCPSAPSATCRTTTEPEASRISYKNPLGTRDRLRWNWRRGGETLLSDFGDPTTTTDYALCVYDKAAGSVRDVMEAQALAGGTCKSGPCWVVSGEGFRYKDSDGRRGPIRSIQLEPGDAGKASVQVNASGPALAPAPMPLVMDPSVRVQLINVENGKCWEATFSTSQESTTEEFRARSD